MKMKKIEKYEDNKNKKERVQRTGTQIVRAHVYQSVCV